MGCELSNISIGFAENYHIVPELKTVFEMFDGLIFSGPIGKIKPNKDIFEHLLNKYNLNANECVFIDDVEENIEGGKNCGMDGIVFSPSFEDVSVLREKLRNKGIKI